MKCCNLLLFFLVAPRSLKLPHLLLLQAAISLHFPWLFFDDPQGKEESVLRLCRWRETLQYVPLAKRKSDCRQVKSLCQLSGVKYQKLLFLIDVCVVSKLHCSCTQGHVCSPGCLQENEKYISLQQNGHWNAKKHLQVFCCNDRMCSKECLF